MKNTIKILSMMVITAGLLFTQPVSAQTDKQQKKENKELKKDQKEIRDAVYQKSEKMAVKRPRNWKRPDGRQWDCQ